MNKFHTMVLLYAAIYTVSNIPVASSLLKQIIILTRVNNPASTMQIREMLIESKHKLLLLKGNITDFQSVGMQTDGLFARTGAGGCQPPLLSMEGLQGGP